MSVKQQKRAVKTPPRNKFVLLLRKLFGKKKKEQSSIYPLR